MGSLFKKTVTRPLPPGAKIITRQGERLARWRDGKGKMRTAPVTTGQNGADRIRDESGTYFGRYRDGNGLVVEVSTGCREKTAAQSVLADLERQAERVRAGLLTPAEARISEHLGKPIAEHVDAYIESMRARGGGQDASRQRAQSVDASHRRLRFRSDLGTQSRSPGAMARQRNAGRPLGSIPERSPRRHDRVL